MTRLLREWNDGAPGAMDQVLSLAYDELREIARRSLATEPANPTSEAADLVHEMYLTLTRCRSVQWRNGDHFFGFAGRTMRRILVDQARNRRAAKRGGDLTRLPLDERLALRTSRPDLVVLGDALESLAAVDERRYRIVELKFFVGLTDREVAGTLGVSVNTVRRRWRSAQEWIRGELLRGPAPITR